MPLPPPRLANRLLRAVLSAEDAEVVAGDLEEAMRRSIEPRAGAAAARRWYWRQVASIVFAYACNRSPQPEVSTPKGPIMSAFRQDIGYALRSLRKQPAFTAIAVAMLAIGIGATVAILSLTLAVLFKPLPFREPSQLMLVHLLAPDRDDSRAAAADDLVVPEVPRVPRSSAGVRRDRRPSRAWNWNLTGAGAPEQVSGELVDGSLSAAARRVARSSAGRFRLEETAGSGFAASGRDRTSILGRTGSRPIRRCSADRLG